MSWFQVSKLQTNKQTNKNLHKCIVWNGKKISSAIFSRCENVTDGMLEIFKFFFSIQFDYQLIIQWGHFIESLFLRYSRLKKGKSCLSISLHDFSLWWSDLHWKSWWAVASVYCCKSLNILTSELIFSVPFIQTGNSLVKAHVFLVATVVFFLT